MSVNFQFVYEGMEESGSEGLDDLLFARKDSFLKVIVNLIYFWGCHTKSSVVRLHFNTSIIVVHYCRWGHGRVVFGDMQF